MKSAERGDGSRQQRAVSGKRRACRAAVVIALVSLLSIPAPFGMPGAAAADSGSLRAGPQTAVIPALGEAPGTDPAAPDTTHETPAADPTSEGEPQTTPDPEPTTDESVGEQPDDWDPDAVYGTGTHFGADGGVASYSPGPEQPVVEPPAALTDAVTGAAGRGAVIGNDYPAKYRNLPFPYVSGISIWDEWNFAYRQCTSFVAWRLRSANGVPFSNQYGGLWAWGDAWQWAGSARSLGIRVDSIPDVGAIAVQGQNYMGAGAYGHVAWVAQVLTNGNIVIEEYNYASPGNYGSRTVAPSAFSSYIHIKDLAQSFTSTAKPKISGAPMVGGTLSAASDAWKPQVSSYSYQWLRNGTAISGATSASYQPTAADLGAVLAVRMTGSAPGYTSATTTSDSTTPVTPTDANGDGITDALQGTPWNTDVNGDGLPDSVGFANGGVNVALATATGQFGAASVWLADFGANQGWTGDQYQRAVMDMNGDGKADIVGFGDRGVYVSLSTGTGFEKAKLWVSNFGTADGWDVGSFQRTLADVNGDGLPDIVGFGLNATLVSLNTGSGFAQPVEWYPGFSYQNGWRVDQDLRMLVDVNGDGKADIVSFKGIGVRVALSTGSKFGAVQTWKQDFGGDQGWSVAKHQRMLADMNGDGKPDVVGFSDGGVYVALNTGSSFGTVNQRAPLWLADFGYAQGWRVGQHPRVLADVSGDGKADVVGFGGAGTYVAVSTGTGLQATKKWTTDFSATTWRSESHPRLVTDVNGDGRADLVGYASDGVRVALSTGSGFGATRLASSGFGFNAGWRNSTHPRATGIQTLSKRATPTVAGEAQVGKQLTGNVGQWAPGPVAVSYQWLRNGQAIAGATGANYAPVPADVDAQVTLRVTGSKLGYAAVSTVSGPVKVAPGKLTPHAPVVPTTGKPGSALQVKVQAWGPAPVKLSYQWNRNGAPIAGATGASYTPSAADAGRRISVTVSGAKDGYSGERLTSGTARIIGTMPAAPKTSPFVDVPTSHRFYTHIAWMYSTGLAVGSDSAGGKAYQPNEPVNRGAMAAFIFRLVGDKDYVAPATSPFADVPTTHTFYRPIAWMYEQGLAVGSPSEQGAVYRPSAPVTRGALAAFIARLEAPAGYRAPSSPTFVDVPTTHTFFRVIEWMHEAGIAAGVPTAHGLAYLPDDPVNRGAMAAFLYRMETRPA